MFTVNTHNINTAQVIKHKKNTNLLKHPIQKYDFREKELYTLFMYLKSLAFPLRVSQSATDCSNFVMWISAA